MTLWVLIKKELRELLRTHKFTVVLVAFAAFGLLSPLTAKMLPELLQAMAGEVVIQLPAPTALMAVDQYLKNLTQMGLLVVVLTAMGAVAGERERGTAAMILCKPVSRAAFVASKFIAYAAVLTAGLALAALACYYYVAVLFERVDAWSFIATNALLGLYLLVLLSLTLLASAIFRSTLAAGGLAFALAMAVSIAGILPNLDRYSPASLIDWGRALVAGTGEVAWPALVASMVLVALCGTLSWGIFRRHEL